MAGFLTQTQVAYAQGTWTTKSSMPTARSADVATANGKVYAIGGQIGASVVSTVEAYDPATDTWTTKSPMPTPRTFFGLVAADGLLYAIGGCTTFDCAGLTGTVEAYDPVADTWTTKAPMPTPRREFGVGVINGVIYAAGGFGGININEAYDPRTNSWSTKAPMLTPQQGWGAVSNGLLYIIDATVEAYDPSTDTWALKAPLPSSPGNGFGAVAVNSTIYVAGTGPNCNGFLAYDPTGNVWSFEAPVPIHCSGYFVEAVTTANGVLYVIGSDSTLRANQAFTPPPACSTGPQSLLYNVSEQNSNASEIVWFNSHLKLQGRVPSTDFTVNVTNQSITFGPSTLAVPNAVITFTSKVNCASTSFNTTMNGRRSFLSRMRLMRTRFSQLASLTYCQPASPRM